MKQIKYISIVLALCLSLLVAGCGSDSHTDAPNDRVALSGIEEGKGFFDINLSDEAKLPLYLNVIRQTYTGLEDQGVSPDFVIAFRGASVTFISEDTVSEAALALIEELAALDGIRFEACAVATGLFGVDNNSVLEEINVVGNTFISSIGYQAKGYAPILIQ